MQNLCNCHNKGIVAALHKRWKLRMSYVSTDFFFLTALPISAVLKCFNFWIFFLFIFVFSVAAFSVTQAFHYSHSSFFLPHFFLFLFKAMRSRSIGECALPSAYIRSAKSAPVLIHTSKPFLPDIVLTPLSDELSGSATSANFCTPFITFLNLLLSNSAEPLNFSK